jgi:hypothetical protein
MLTNASQIAKFFYNLGRHFRCKVKKRVMLRKEVGNTGVIFGKAVALPELRRYLMFLCHPWTTGRVSLI